VLPGTWSDDSSQALCLFNSLRECGGLDLEDLAQRLVSWMYGGYMAVDKCPFDVGLQTSRTLSRYKSGIPAEESGLGGERNCGNGSLMRTLPLALLWEGDDASLVAAAHRQSLITHTHPRVQVCCALYCLWARRELQGMGEDSWARAVADLRAVYGSEGVHRDELDNRIHPEEPVLTPGGGYVVTSLKSAHQACMEKNYEDTVKRAIAFGIDTDTTACLAGGIAGIRHGVQGIPMPWWNGLRGKEILVPIVEKWIQMLR
jgi:ADP-ribosyl-[dinitrogen reductase] hydrolase